jgi:hypothetical protein
MTWNDIKELRQTESEAATTSFDVIFDTHLLFNILFVLLVERKFCSSLLYHFAAFAGLETIGRGITTPKSIST